MTEQKEPEPWELLEDEPDDKVEPPKNNTHGNVAVFGENTPTSRSEFKTRRDRETDAKKEIFLRFISQGLSVNKAAMHAGWKDPRAVQLLAKKDKSFREAWDLANECKDQVLVDRIYDVAVNGVLEPLVKDGVPTGFHIRKIVPKIMEVAVKGGQNKKDFKGQEGAAGGVNIGVFVLPGRQKSLDDFASQTKRMHEGQKMIELEPDKVVDVVIQKGHSLERSG